MEGHYSPPIESGLETAQPTAPDSSHRKKFRIVILGAGFSRPAGLPLAAELWIEVRRRAEVMTGRAGQFRQDLANYLAFRKKCRRGNVNGREVDFEDFMAFLDLEFYLGLRGSDTWSSDGNESQVVVKTLIGEILTERMPPRLPDVYLRFADALQPDDYVLTFNYDVVLERALEAVGKPFRLFPDRYQTVFPGMATVDHSREEVVLLKLHGSVDWFDRKQYRELEENRAAHGLQPGHPDPVFGPAAGIRLLPLVDGPRFPNDPLREMYRVLDIERAYGQRLLFRATPALLNPSTAKILYASKLKDFWWGLGGVGTLNFGMAIIGFSLPVQDEYACQVLYRLVSNYQGRYWRKVVLEHKKSPLLIVDLRKGATSKRDFRRRYAFVNWRRASTYFGGFNEEAVTLLKD